MGEGPGVGAAGWEWWEDGRKGRVFAADGGFLYGTGELTAVLTDLMEILQMSASVCFRWSQKVR